MTGRLLPAPHHAIGSAPASLDRFARDRRSSAFETVARLSAGPGGLLNQRVEAIDGTRVRIAGRWVLNFTSSNYLGFDGIPSVRARIGQAARLWGSSLATPRLLVTDTLTARVEKALADLVQREAALLFPSTLHAALDVLTLLAGSGGRILIDENAYPISTTAARIVSSAGHVPLRFRHNSPATLQRLLAAPRSGAATVVVCDGVYPLSGLPATLHEIGQLAMDAGAFVYVDDAHGLGVLGEGGGGTVLHTGADPVNIAYVSSLSKALGVPLAFVAGPATFIELLRATSSSVVHSSPPALPVVAAAEATLALHAECGNERRYTLFGLVDRFRHGVRLIGLPLLTKTVFPVQSVGLPNVAAAVWAGCSLRRHGIWPVIALGPEGGPALRFVLTAAHTRSDIDEALDALVAVVNGDYPMRL